MTAQDKILVRFNIKNVKYAVQIGGLITEAWNLGYADSISLESNYTEKIIYGDGRVVHTIPNDKGKTGTLTLLAINEEYEYSMGRRLQTSKGYAEIKQSVSRTHALYFETDYIETDGEVKTAKTILYGVTSGRPSETYNQTTEDINDNKVSYPLTIKGIAMQKADGTAYKDQYGNTVYVWQETCLPGDPGYDTFGTKIEAPTAPATQTTNTQDDPLNL